MRQEPAINKKSRGRPRTDAEIEDWIKRWATEKDWSPTQIHRILERMKQEEKIAQVPGLRTIQRVVTRCKDDSGPWSLTDANAEDAALILPVLADVLEHTEGQAVLTKGQAQLVVKVARNAPGLHPWHVYRLAVGYRRRGDKGDTADLDAILAFRPWESRDAMCWFQDWVRDHRPEWLREDATVWYHASVPAESRAEPWAPAVEGMFIVFDMEMDRALATPGMNIASVTKGTVPGPDPAREALLRLQRQRRREGNAEPLPPYEARRISEEDNDEPQK